MNEMKLFYFYILINCVSIHLGQSSNRECCLREISSELYSEECLDSEVIKSYQFQNFTKSINSSLGLLEVEVTFSVDLCTDKFMYLLKYQQTQNKNECTEDADFLSVTDSEYIHTRLIKEEEKCIKKGTKEILKFSNVFSGCYTVEIINCSENQKKRLLLKPFYITTDMEYIHMTKDCRPTVFPQIFNEDKKTLDISITFFKSSCFLNNKLKLELRDSKHFSKKIIIENLDSESKSLNFSKNHPTSDVECFRTTNRSFDCVIKKLHTNLYQVLIQLLNDPRCKPFTLWNLNTSLPCEWDLKINMTNLIEIRNNSETNFVSSAQKTTIQLFYGIIFVGIIIVCCVVLCVLFVYFKLKNRNNNVTNNEILIQRIEYDKIEMKSNFYSQMPRVFLLYARDCEEFMTLMKNFKNVLKKNEIIEVYDIFDENMNRDVCAFQEKWILEKIVDPDVKIILILTKLAQLNYGLNNIHYLYKKPTFKDKYFTYALKKIIENFSSDYQKLYVVELDIPFKINSKEFEVISPFRRYILPRHFNELVTNILSQNIDNTELKQYKETCKFNEAFNTYRLHVENNPEYLKNITNL